MDRITIEQLNKIEEYTENMMESMQDLVNENEIETIFNFYEKEVLEEEGKLKHLKDDKVLSKFMEELDKEQDEENDEDEDGEEDYVNKPFK